MMLITYTTISVVNMPKPCQSGTEFTLTLGPNYHSSLVPRPLTQKERVWYISSVYFFTIRAMWFTCDYHVSLLPLVRAKTMLS